MPNEHPEYEDAIERLLNWMSAVYRILSSSDSDSPWPSSPVGVSYHDLEPMPRDSLVHADVEAVLQHVKDALVVLKAESPPDWPLWARSLIMLTQRACIGRRRLQGDSDDQLSALLDEREFREGLAGSSLSESDFDAALSIILSSAKPFEALPSVFEELLWRSGFGVAALKVLQRSILLRFIEARDALKNRSGDARSYRLLTHRLSVAVNRRNLGPVTLAIARFNELDSRPRAALSDAFSLSELKSLYIQLVELNECGSNLLATNQYMRSFGFALVDELARLSTEAGPTAARQWLRECRNIKLFPPRYQFECLDRLLREGVGTLELLGRCLKAEDYQDRGDYIVTITPKDDAPVQFKTNWFLFAANFVLVHEMGHVAFANWSGYPDEDDGSPSRNALHFGRIAAPGQVSIGIEDFSGVYELEHVVDDEVSLLDQRVIEAIEESANLRHAGRARTAAARLATMRDEIQAESAHATRLRLELDNALAGALRDSGDLEAATALYETCIHVANATLGTGSRQALIMADNLAAVQVESGDLLSAVKTRQRVVISMRTLLGRLDTNALRASLNLAQTQLQAGESGAAYLELSTLAFEAYGRLPTRDYIALVDALGTSLLASGRSAEAIELRVDLLHESTRQFGKHDRTTRIVRGNLYAAYVAHCRLEKNVFNRAWRWVQYWGVILRWAGGVSHERQSPLFPLQDQVR